MPIRWANCWADLWPASIRAAFSLFPNTFLILWWRAEIDMPLFKRNNRGALRKSSRRKFSLDPNLNLRYLSITDFIEKPRNLAGGNQIAGPTLGRVKGNWVDYSAGHRGCSLKTTFIRTNGFSGGVLACRKILIADVPELFA